MESLTAVEFGMTETVGQLNPRTHFVSSKEIGVAFYLGTQAETSLLAAPRNSRNILDTYVLAAGFLTEERTNTKELRTISSGFKLLHYHYSETAAGENRL